MRAIDADGLKAYLGLEKPYNEYWDMERYFCDAINAQPTIDAAPVVRCKDCKHKIEDKIGGMFCSIYRCEMKYDDFCSRGDRK